MNQPSLIDQTALAAIPSNALAPPSPATLDRLHEADRLIRSCPQVEILTEHLLHGGMYARTIRRGPGVVAVGSVILRATILIVNGPCSLLTDRGRLDLSGYNVLPGLPGRKSFSLTHGPVEMTMIFPTSARTVAEAEEEIFGEASDLMSRQDGNENQVTITGQ
jgi:hypothetical protein